MASSHPNPYLRHHRTVSSITLTESPPDSFSYPATPTTEEWPAQILRHAQSQQQLRRPATAQFPPLCICRLQGYTFCYMKHSDSNDSDTHSIDALDRRTPRWKTYVSLEHLRIAKLQQSYESLKELVCKKR